jgi:hypothetical protein
MSKAEQLKDEAILEKLRKLSLDKKREILDFLEFLETREIWPASVLQRKMMFSMRPAGGSKD